MNDLKILYGMRLLFRLPVFRNLESWTSPSQTIYIREEKAQGEYGEAYFYEIEHVRMIRANGAARYFLKLISEYLINLLTYRNFSEAYKNLSIEILARHGAAMKKHLHNQQGAKPHATSRKISH